MCLDKKNIYFSTIREKVKQPENYVPRDYQTIGGMWTVDTWLYEDTKVQVADEGYTTIISTDKVIVREDYKNDILFDKGGEEELSQLFHQFCE